MSIVTVSFLSLIGYWQFADCQTGLSKQQGDAFKIYQKNNSFKDRKLRLQLLFLNSRDRTLVADTQDNEENYVFKNFNFTMRLQKNEKNVLKIEEWTYKKKPVSKEKLCIYKRSD